MKMKVSNFISQYLVDHNINTAFMITGGGAMHLNDAIGHQKGMLCIYNHHEQASAIAAEAFYRINNQLPVVSVTTGPGGTNAITGVLGGWLDSIPMLIISGQVRYDTMAESTGLDLRSMGDQEFNIIKSVSCMTKYAELVTDPMQIKYSLQKAIYLAKAGRPGPTWLDIPLNVQGAFIETDQLPSFSPEIDYDKSKPKVKMGQIHELLQRLKSAKRPVINAGSSIRSSGAYQQFLELVEKLNIPVVTGWNSIDLIPTDHQIYTGRAGLMGDRAGNFAIQNSDFILSLGSRLSVRQVGYNAKTWAREAYVAMVDIDANELKKPTIHVELPIHADLLEVIEILLQQDIENISSSISDWRSRCHDWKTKYPVVQNKHHITEGLTNIYSFMDQLSRKLPENTITVVGNGSACVVGSHAYFIKRNQRFIINSAVASMGYDLPAAIGASLANNKSEIICITGDGSIQMNLQELQTILTNKLPIKIFVINNGGYHSIRQTQKNFFTEPLIGIGPESHDLEFPSIKKLAEAYGYPYYKCTSNIEISTILETTLICGGPLICEIFVSQDQLFEPKSATKKLNDGTLISAPLEDLAPFLSREEFLSNMIISPLDESLKI